MNITELNIELELHYVSCCLEIVEDYGYCNDNNYMSMERMSDNAESGINKTGFEEKYLDRIKTLPHKAREFGIELYYQECMYKEGTQ